MCEYKNCDRAPYTGLNTCIFHTPIEIRKDNRIEHAFNNEFRDYVLETYGDYRESKAESKNDIVLNCEGFIFYNLFDSFLSEEYSMYMLKIGHVTIPFKVNFKKVIIERPLQFFDSTFIGEVHWDGAEIGVINKDGDFNVESKTGRKSYDISVLFENTRFKSGVSFNGAKFYCYSSFRSTEFSSFAHFTQVEFHEKCDFLFAYFDRFTSFSDSFFGGDAVFQLARFKKKVNFTDAKFMGFTDFQQTEYWEKGVFNGIKVENELRLGSIAKEFERKENRDFIRDEDNRPIVKDAAAIIELQRADFRKDAKATFTGTLLKKWSFVKTIALKDPNIFDFEDSIWKLPEEKEIIIRDESLIGKESIDVENVAEVYRRLQLNYEKRLAYGLASDFHAGHMRMLLINPNIPNSKKSFLRLYKLVSGFGESVIRPLIWFFILWGCFSIVWSFFPSLDSLVTPTGLFSGDFVWPWDWLKSSQLHEDFRWVAYLWDKTWFTFKTFFTFPSTNVGPFEQSVGVIQRVMGIYVIALFILALRRAFRR